MDKIIIRATKKKETNYTGEINKKEKNKHFYSIKTKRLIKPIEIEILVFTCLLQR